MGNIENKNTNLTPKTLYFGGDDRLPEFPKNIYYKDDEKLDFNISENSIDFANKENPNINEYINLRDIVKLDCQLNNKIITLPKNKQNMTTVYNTLITLSVDDIKSSSKTSIDLICVIDCSWSMKGEKLQQIKESFQYLFEYLDEKDRVSILVFDNDVERLTPLLCMTSENKQKILVAVNKVIAKGGTNIAYAVQHALEVIKQRLYINNVTSVFLLSDGIDLNADKKIRALINREKFFIKDTFSLHTFGYGLDVDTKMLSSIAQLQDGNYYFIDNLQKVDECFLGCLGGLLSIVAQDVVITISEYSEVLRDVLTLKINKAYGMEDTWTYDYNDNTYTTIINQLISGRKYNFLFDIEIGFKDINRLQDMNNITFIKANCIMKGLKESGYRELSLCAVCQAPVARNDQYINLNENNNEDVLYNYYRFKSGEALIEAKGLSDNCKYEDAKVFLSKLIDVMKWVKTDMPEFKSLIKDLDNALLHVEPGFYQKGGSHFIVQSYDSKMRERHNIGTLSKFSNSGQERMVLRAEQRKMILK